MENKKTRIYEDFRYLYDNSTSCLHCYHHENEGGFKPDFLHFHTNYELLLITEGDARVVNNDCDLRVSAPCVLLHAPNSYHVVQVDEGCHYSRYILYFNSDNLAKIEAVIPGVSEYMEKHRFRVYGENDADMRDILELVGLYRRTTHRRDDFNLTMTAAVISVLMKMTCSFASVETKNSKYLSELIEYVNLHFTEDITADELAKRFFVSRGKIFRDFKRLTSFNPHEYIALLRMNFARQLLTREMSSADVAKACGYNTFSTFARTFRIYEGMSPQDYRQKCGLTR